MPNTDPFRPADETARQMARQLLEGATFGALAVLRPEDAQPSVSRIALATDENTGLMTLISELSDHTRALHMRPECALLIGEPSGTGDPLTHPRLTLQAKAEFVDRDTADHFALRDRYLALRPKAKVYVDFTDFSFVRFRATEGMLNGGFGKAWRLAPKDIWPDQRTT